MKVPRMSNRDPASNPCLLALGRGLSAEGAVMTGVPWLLSKTTDRLLSAVDAISVVVGDGRKTRRELIREAQHANVYWRNRKDLRRLRGAYRRRRGMRRW